MHPFHQRSKSQCQSPAGLWMLVREKKLHDWLWQEDCTIDCDNVGIKGSPLMVPAATMSLQMNNRRTKAIPARANGISNNMYRLEQCMHLELPRARLRPGLHWPHKSPDLLFVHCRSVLLRETNVVCGWLAIFKWAVWVENQCLRVTVISHPVLSLTCYCSFCDVTSGGVLLKPWFTPTNPFKWIQAKPRWTGKEL